jgi:hypothetical protein
MLAGPRQAACPGEHDHSGIWQARPRPSASGNESGAGHARPNIVSVAFLALPFLKEERMGHWNRRATWRKLSTALSFTAALAVLVPATGCVVTARGRVGYVAETAPPPEQYEEVPPPKGGYVWVKGYYEYQNGQYVWRRGYWERARQNSVWVDGHWERRGRQYHWVPGRWETGGGHGHGHGHGQGGGGTYIAPGTGGGVQVNDHRQPPPQPQPQPQRGGVVVVPTRPGRPAPPAPPAEAYPAPKAGYVWVRGHYTWNGSAYSWTPGHWERQRGQQRWVDGRWENQGNDWIWIEGRWE